VLWETILSAENSGKPFGQSGLCPETNWESSQRSPDPLAGGEGVAPLSKNPTPAFGPNEKSWTRS